MNISPTQPARARPNLRGPHLTRRTAGSRQGRRRRTMAAVATFAALAVGSSACGDDDSTSVATTGRTASAGMASTTATAATATTATISDGAFGGPSWRGSKGSPVSSRTSTNPWRAGGRVEPGGHLVSATGVSDIATGAPLEPDMQFKIASQTKTFTANLVLQLVGEHKVSLDDHISKSIDGVPNGDEITIRQLLNHTSGLADGFTSPTIQGQVQTGCTVDDLLTAEAEFEQVAAPGEKWSYSNYGYNLLGRVVELVTGQDLSTVLQERIAVPLGLTRTSLPTLGSGLTAPYTHGYGTGDLGPTQPATVGSDATDLPGSCLWAHGAMVSTLEDMRVWAVSLAAGSLLTPEVSKEATTDMVPFVFGGNYNGPGLWRYGLGFVEPAASTAPRAASPTTSRRPCARHPEHDDRGGIDGDARRAVPPPIMQALAIALYGDDVDFGLTLDQAMEPNLGASHEAAGPTTTTSS